MSKRTKIVCTIGPSSESQALLEKMIASGMNVARLNFSHNVHEHHAMLIKRLRAASAKMKTPIAIQQDLQGPRIRIGNLGETGIAIRPKMEVVLVPESKYAKLQRATKDVVLVPTQYEALARDVKTGSTILIEDGTVQLRVKKVSGLGVVCEVVAGALIKTHKGMNFPDTTINAGALTPKDREDVRFGVEQGIDFVALSFVKNSEDILELRSLIASLEKKYPAATSTPHPVMGTTKTTRTKIIAKIERKEAVTHFEDILRTADAIMVARGDLGLEIPIEELPEVQKNIIRRCVEEGKPVIVATQMLDSMIRNPIPTRAEVLDVANAILDGTDAVMLSGETASGSYPLQALQTMAKISKTAEERAMSEYENRESDLKKCCGVTEAIGFAVQDIAEDIGAKLIVCPTISGFTAQAISRFRPSTPIIAWAVSPQVQRQLCLSWGVRSYHMPFANSFDGLLKNIKALLQKEKLAKKGDSFVLVAGHPFGHSGQTNLIKVEQL